MDGGYIIPHSTHTLNLISQKLNATSQFYMMMFHHSNQLQRHIPHTSTSDTAIEERMEMNKRIADGSIINIFESLKIF